MRISLVGRFSETNTILFHKFPNKNITTGQRNLIAFLRSISYEFFLLNMSQIQHFILYLRAQILAHSSHCTKKKQK